LIPGAIQQAAAGSVDCSNGRCKVLAASGD